jgi:hypothetical protein
MYKICSKCKEDKLLSEFSRDIRAKDGLQCTCKICVKNYYLSNKSKILARVKEYRIDNKEQIGEYLIANKERIAARQVKYQEGYRRDNRDKINARCARRRAAKLNATPNWLTAEEFEQITELYTCAQMFKLYTGQEYHVDHIVPLQGENACGLHVPWNLQVIPAKENVTKSNKLLD